MLDLTSRKEVLSFLRKPTTQSSLLLLLPLGLASLLSMLGQPDSILLRRPGDAPSL